MPTAYYDSNTPALVASCTIHLAVGGNLPANGDTIAFDDGLVTGTVEFNDTADPGDGNAWIDTSSGNLGTIRGLVLAQLVGFVGEWTSTAGAAGDQIDIVCLTPGAAGNSNTAAPTGAHITSTGFSGGRDAGTTNQSLDEASSYWTDSARTIPYGGVPASTVDIVAYDGVATGAQHFNSWADAGTNPITGGTITVTNGHSVTGVTVNGGTVAAASPSTALTAPGLHLISGTISVVILTLQSTATLDADPSVSTIVDTDGTTVWNSAAAASVSAPSMTHGTASGTFSGTITTPNFNLPDATVTTIHQTGPSVTLICAAPGPSAVVWTGVQQANTNNVSVYDNSTPTAPVITWDSTATATMVEASEDAILVAGGGNYVPPVQNTVLSEAQGGTKYGVGSATDGTLTLSPEDSTLVTITNYGKGGNSRHGNYTAFDPAYVDSSQTGGVGNLVPGGNVMPSNDKVLRPGDGGPAHYGPSNAQIGTLAAGVGGSTSVSASYGKFYKGF